MLDGAQVFLSKPAGVSQQIQSSPGELWNEAWLEDEEDCVKKKERCGKGWSELHFVNVHLTAGKAERLISRGYVWRESETVARDLLEGSDGLFISPQSSLPLS